MVSFIVFGLRKCHIWRRKEEEEEKKKKKKKKKIRQAHRGSRQRTGCPKYIYRPGMYNHYHTPIIRCKIMSVLQSVMHTLLSKTRFLKGYKKQSLNVTNVLVIFLTLQSSLAWPFIMLDCNPPPNVITYKGRFNNLQCFNTFRWSVNWYCMHESCTFAFCAMVAQTHAFCITYKGSKCCIWWIKPSTVSKENLMYGISLGPINIARYYFHCFIYHKPPPMLFADISQNPDSRSCACDWKSHLRIELHV